MVVRPHGNRTLIQFNLGSLADASRRCTFLEDDKPQRTKMRTKVIPKVAADAELLLQTPGSLLQACRRKMIDLQAEFISDLNGQPLRNAVFPNAQIQQSITWFIEL